MLREVSELACSCSRFSRRASLSPAAARLALYPVRNQDLLRPCLAELTKEDSNADASQARLNMILKYLFQQQMFK